MKAALYAIFFLSGAAALVFETLWFRQAGLAFGNSVWATSLVLTGFMAGLGLGNALAARVADRFENPVRSYAMVEATIAVTGIALVLLLPSVGVWLAPLFRRLMATPVLLGVVRFALAFAMLLVPATAMGVTLPLMTRSLGAIESRFGAVLGALYGWNTIGAMVGVIATEAVLLGAFGIRGTALFAGSCNLLAAGLALTLSRNAVRVPRLDPYDAEPVLWGLAAPWLGAAFLSGFAVLAYEVVWFRFLLLYVRGVGMSFALMLGTVLAGIALGGWSAAVKLRQDDYAHHDAFAVVVRAAIAALLSYAAFPAILGLLAHPKPETNGEVLMLAVELMFPTSFFSGMFFTLVGASLRDSFPSEASTTGALTLANTVGAALGSFTAGFFLLPGIGMEKSIFVLGLVLAASGALLANVSETPRRTLVAPFAVFVVVCLFFPFGVMNDFHIRKRATWYEGQIVEVREGIAETIVYLEEQILGHPWYYRMITNGYSMSGSSVEGRRYMKLYTYLPMAVNPRIRHVLMVNYGVGQTAKSLVDTKSIETIDIVDISRDVVDMDRNVFRRPGERPPDDPRVKVHIEDGRFFLQTTDRKFDLFTGEPPPPPLAGVVNLYTREYFQLIRDHLSEGGFVTYWLPIHNLSDVSSKAILRAFCDVFTDCQLWNGMDTSLMMVGSNNFGGGTTTEGFTAQWRDPDVKRELDAVGFEHPEEIGSLFLGGTDYLRKLTADTPSLVDDNPKLIVAPFTKGTVKTNPLYMTWVKAGDEARERFFADPVIRKWLPRPMIDGAEQYFPIQRIIDEYAHRRKPPFAMADTVLMTTDLSTPVLWLLDSDSDVQAILAGMSDAERAAPEASYHAGVGALSRRDWSAAARAFEIATKDAKWGARAARLRVYALARGGDEDGARIAMAAVRASDFARPPDDESHQFWTWWDQEPSLPH